jgi:hypothetical protein
MLAVVAVVEPQAVGLVVQEVVVLEVLTQPLQVEPQTQVVAVVGLMI